MTRNFAYDNTKFLMIFLVVYGHLLESLTSQGALIKGLYMSIYSFHMPVFVLLAGLLTKPEHREDQSAKIIQSTLVPLIVFTVIYEALNIMTTGQISGYTSGLQPYWLLWFLFSLFMWRLFSPLFMQLNHPIPIAIGISLVAGYFDQIGYFLGLSRTLYFFPFFLVGQQLNLSGVDLRAYREKIPKLIPIGILVLNLAIFMLADNFSARWLFGSSSYRALGLDQLGVLLRLAIYGLSFSTAMAILLLIPATKTWMSARGQNSLHIYVWHGLLVKLLAMTGVIALTGGWPQAVVLGFWLVVSLPITLALSTTAVAQWTQRRLLAPVTKLLLKPTSAKTG